MMKKVVCISLSILIFFILFIAISSFITVNKYNNIASHIDKDISNKQRQIKIKKKEYSNLKDENDIKYMQIDNMDSYINELDKKVKEYEK